MPSSPDSPAKRQIVFIHLDLGIGGAEMLVLELAKASVDAGHSVTIVTSHCSQLHCFGLVHKPDGLLCENVVVWGDWIPANFFGMGTALCSTIRMLYLSLRVLWTKNVQFGRRRRQNDNYNDSDTVVVLDVLPTPIPLLLSYFHVLFYCHFPDKLLTRDTVNGEPTTTFSNTTSVPSSSSWLSRLAKVYRACLDSWEECTMAQADVLVVNSKFTQQTLQREFMSLKDKPMRVLYPALLMDDDIDSGVIDGDSIHSPSSGRIIPIVSLNRFERKKNIELALHAYARLKQKIQERQSTSSSSSCPTQLLERHPLVIAGGYDVYNVENVEYMAELKTLARDLQLQAHVSFRPSVSDDERTRLLSTALCVLYTPHKEHFGIVPLEVMYRRRPVICVRSGGPLETVRHNETGFLCDNTPESFACVMYDLVCHPDLARVMGQAGHEHVVEKFGVERFQSEWCTLVEDTVACGRRRQQSHRHRGYCVVGCGTLVYLLEAAVMLLVVWVLTVVLRRVGVIGVDSHILGSLQRAWRGGEL